MSSLDACRINSYKRDLLHLTKNTDRSLFHRLRITLRMHFTAGTLSRFELHRERTMNMHDMMAEIRDANLSYLMLAQQMIRSDKPAAIFRLGIGADIADLLEKLSNSQLLKLAGANMMLARFRYENNTILGMLTDYNKDRSLSQTQTTNQKTKQPNKTKTKTQTQNKHKEGV